MWNKLNSENIVLWGKTVMHVCVCWMRDQDETRKENKKQSEGWERHQEEAFDNVTIIEYLHNLTTISFLPTVLFWFTHSILAFLSQ